MEPPDRAQGAAHQHAAWNPSGLERKMEKFSALFKLCKYEKLKFTNLQFCSQGFIQQFFGCQDCARHFDQTIRKVFRGVNISPVFMDGFIALL